MDRLAPNAARRASRARGARHAWRRDLEANRCAVASQLRQLRVELARRVDVSRTLALGRRAAEQIRPPSSTADRPSRGAQSPEQRHETAPAGPVAVSIANLVTRALHDARRAGVALAADWRSAQAGCDLAEGAAACAVAGAATAAVSSASRPGARAPSRSALSGVKGHALGTLGSHSQGGQRQGVDQFVEEENLWGRRHPATWRGRAQDLAALAQHALPRGRTRPVRRRQSARDASPGAEAGQLAATATALRKGEQASKNSCRQPTTNRRAWLCSEATLLAASLQAEAMRSSSICASPPSRLRSMRTPLRIVRFIPPSPGRRRSCR